MNTRRVGSSIAIGVVLLLVWLLVPSERPAPAAAAPAPSAARVAAPARSAATECTPPTITPGARKKPDDSVAAELEWRGDESLLQRNQHKRQELLPTQIGFSAIASQMASYFPIMDRPPATKGEENLYHHYDKKMNAMLHMEGDRANLGSIHMTLFDRINAPSARLDTQAEMTRHFLAGAFKDSPLSLGTDVEAFLNAAKPGSSEAPKQKTWNVGSNVLTVSTIDGYGMVTLTVSAAEPS